MLFTKDSWVPTLLCATIAVVFAAVGLASATLYPGATPLLTTALLVGSLGGTAGAFTLLATRVRRLELENMGLIEEISQEFDRVKDKIEIFSEALQEPRTLETQAPPEAPAARRVVVK